MKTETFTTIIDTLEKYKSDETIALICGDEKLTYRELVADSKHIAGALLSEGVKKGDRVILCMGRTANAIRGLLGILYAGCSYVAVDPDWPEERLNFVAKDAKTIFSMTDENFLRLREKEFVPPELPKVNGEDEAAIYYTSGSTGQPKGAVLHHIVLGSVSDLKFGLNLPEWNVHLCYMKLSFIAALLDFFTVFIMGKTLVLTTDEEQKSVDALAESMQKNHVDFIGGTPSLMLRFLENKNFRHAFSKLKCVTFGAERIIPGIARKISSATNAELTFKYGSSEAFLCTEYCYRGDGESHLGRATHGVKVYVLNENLEKILPGEDGELFIGGIQAKYGHYLNRPDLDAEKYFEHPKFGRLFRTGDIVRLETDGDITILGRKDGMIKLHGQRIEIGEIESAFENFSGIKRGAVKLIGESPNEILAAYYTVSQDVSETELRKYLADRLPYYMVPSLFVKLDSMPENDHGKLNYRALPQPEIPKSEYVPPETEREKLLCEIFSDVLKCEEPLGVNDNFLNLGADSINVIIAASRLREKGYTFKTNHLFIAPTARLLAPMLTPVAEEKILPDNFVLPELSPERLEKIEEKVGRGNVECVYPVTRLADEKITEGSSWIECFIWEINSSDMTNEKFKERLTEMTQKHYALRSVFVRTEKESLQVVLRRHEPDIFFADLRSICEGEKLSSKQKSYFRNLIRLDASGSRDLEQDVIFRAGLVQISPTKSMVYISFSHLLLDGTGISLIMREIMSDEEIRPDKNIWKKRFSRIFSTDNTASLAYWQKLLDGCQGFTRLPQKTGATGQVSPTGYYIAGEKKIYERTAKYCAANKVTVAALIHYIFGKTLMKMLSVDEVCFCSMASGKTAEDMDLPGMSIFYFPVRLCSGDSLSDCQAQLLSSVAHSGLWSFSVPDFVTSWGICPIVLDIQNFLSADGKNYKKTDMTGLADDFYQILSLMQPLFESNAEKERTVLVAETDERMNWLGFFNENRYDAHFMGHLYREVVRQFRKTVEPDSQ